MLPVTRTVNKGRVCAVDECARAAEKREATFAVTSEGASVASELERNDE